jgi:hypothetical protein
LTETVKVVTSLAGTVTESGKLIRSSPDAVVPASNGESDALVLGVNLNAVSENVWEAPFVFDRMNVNRVGIVTELLIRPKLAESGSNKIVAAAAWVRFSRPGPLGRRPDIHRSRLRVLDNTIGGVG